jgi:hypothetical protein
MAQHYTFADIGWTGNEFTARWENHFRRRGDSGRAGYAETRV